MKTNIKFLLFIASLLVFFQSCEKQRQESKSVTNDIPNTGQSVKKLSQNTSVILITNVNVFDGKGDKLIKGMSVLVEGNKISKIDKDIAVPDSATVIDGGGRTLMPGLIDMHYHVAIASTNLEDAMGSYAPDLDFMGISAALEAERVLMRGFTSIRDVGGPSWGAKLASDRGMINGPRIWPSLRCLSQFGGHGDGSPRFMEPREFGGPENFGERIHYSRIVTGADEVTLAVRENLKKGASQIKMLTSGGVGTEFDPIDGVQFTQEEIHAAVVAAENFGTYVAVHAYIPEGIRQAVEAGVKSVEHGNLLDEPTMKLIAEKGVYLSPEILVYNNLPASLGPVRLAKGKQVLQGLDTMFELAKKYKVKIVFGTDVVWNAEDAKKQNDELVNRAKYFTNAEVLAQATSTAGELLQLSGAVNPYPGNIGVIAEDAFADILLVNGDPLEDISILANPEDNIALIMKDGKIYKNIIK